MSSLWSYLQDRLHSSDLALARNPLGAPRPRRTWAQLTRFQTPKLRGAQLLRAFGRNMNMPFTTTQPDNEHQLVFTSSQAAHYVGVSLATIRRWTDAGHISCYRTPGGQRRFSRDQLDDFMSSMHRDGPSGQGVPARSRNGQHQRAIVS
jgi:excisionase family DNA binding protein